MTYIIVKDASENQLMLDVNKALAQGFKLAGGLAVAYIVEAKALFFAQALYKKGK
jgi:hypothetical protein